MFSKKHFVCYVLVKAHEDVLPTVCHSLTAVMCEMLSVIVLLVYLVLLLPHRFLLALLGNQLSPEKSTSCVVHCVIQCCLCIVARFSSQISSHS